ncbi:MAG: glycosyltransferase family 2 protein [Lachnospiraceae bacterium]|nr:glycosyltransferase family 2 protein [Lachnospiraceae bacterium]
MEPLISVIVPVYNAQDVITETFGNLVYQSFFERYGEEVMELILVDDCSTDGTGALLDSFYAQFPGRIRVIHLEEHAGPGGARNAGMDAARGAYIGFADCDDIVDVTFYERLYEKATEGGVFYDIVDSPLYYEDTQQAVLATPEPYAGTLDAGKKQDLLTEIGVLFTRLIKRDLIEDPRVRTREHVTSEDEDFLAELICRAQSVNVLMQPLYVRKENRKKKLGADVGDMMKPFGIFVSCAISAFGRLSALEDYEALRLGAEAFYYKRLSKALQLYAVYHKAGLLSEDMDAQILSTLHRTAETVARTPYTDNPYVMHAFSEKELRRMERYL